MSNQKTVLVTGANSDIGVEVCRLFLKKGEKIIAMVHSSSEKLEGLLNESIKVVRVDFSRADNVEMFIKNSRELLNSVDIFVSLASVRKSISYGSINSFDLLSHFTVNTIPTILLIQYLGASMSEKGWGRIVIGSSIGVKFGGGNDSYCYSMTKYAAELIPNMAKQWSKKNVLVNVVRIGVTDTSKFREIGKEKVEEREKLIPMQRLAQAEEIANSICWVGSKENTYISGQIVAVSGGE